LTLQFAQLGKLAMVGLVLGILLLSLLLGLLLRLWPVDYLSRSSYNFVRVDHVMLSL
jgi:hypothetical protein